MSIHKAVAKSLTLTTAILFAGTLAMLGLTH